MSSYSDFANSASDILLKKGDAIAQGKARSGELWGSTVSTLGQQIPQQVQAAIKQAAEKRKTAQIQGILQQNGGDLDKALPLIMGVDATIGAKLAEDHAKVQKSVAEVQDIKQKAEKAQLEFSDRLWGQVHDEDSYAHAALVSHRLGEEVPPQYDPTWVDGKKHSLLSLKDQLEIGKPPADYTIGDKRFSGKTNEVLATAGLTDEQRAVNARLEGTAQVAAANTATDNARADAAQKGAESARQEQARHNKAMEARPVGGSAAASSLDPDGLELAATEYRLTHRLPARNAGQNGAIISAAAAQGKALGNSPSATIQKQAAYAGDTKALSKMQSMSAAAEAFESKALAQADIISELSSKVTRTKFPLINAALQSGRVNITGDEDATKLANAISTFAAEYAKIIEGSTGSAAGSSDSARAASNRLINTALSKGTMTGVLDLMKREMALTIGGYGAVIGHITDRMGGTPAPIAAPAVAPPTGRYNPATGKVE